MIKETLGSEVGEHGHHLGQVRRRKRLDQSLYEQSEKSKKRKKIRAAAIEKARKEKEAAEGGPAYQAGISLEGNDMKNLQSADFHKNTEIEYLSLPPLISCPGSNGTWLNESSDVNSTTCLFEQNACKVHNVTCPTNSHCVHSGVDMAECLCNNGFHGYKCLEQGVFPVTSFLIGITVPTILICIFLYVTQRRHVIQQGNKKK
ncbi:all-trans retinoic acid-induced differentiation factor-like [Elysia marginata]|uniref:All-trans retinoic acid-induced differentiation factor-like n=1 Tax=Elysia marginata TaxID=1093978 RepID=A0AAV4ENJ2_9GAST|nr:all-trans retinoic acid-induced differentiation factor-like [Elysia marginata]